VPPSFVFLVTQASFAHSPRTALPDMPSSHLHYPESEAELVRVPVKMASESGEGVQLRSEAGPHRHT